MNKKTMITLKENGKVDAWRTWRNRQELEKAIERNKEIGFRATLYDNNKVMDRCLERNNIMQECLRKFRRRLENE